MSVNLGWNFEIAFSYNVLCVLRLQQRWLTRLHAYDEVLAWKQRDPS